MLLKKINIKKSIKARKNFIDNILKNEAVNKSIKNYSISLNEGSLLLRAILFKNHELLKLACDLRAKEI